jgi:hypothetical protein
MWPFDHSDIGSSFQHWIIDWIIGTLIDPLPPVVEKATKPTAMT